MTSPIDYPATVDAVAGWLHIPDDGAGVEERRHVAEVVPAVNAFVRRFHPGAALDPDVIHGAVMLAARIVRRRNSPAGVENFGELGATYVARYDPDVNMLLGLANYRRIVVG